MELKMTYSYFFNESQQSGVIILQNSKIDTRCISGIRLQAYMLNTRSEKKKRYFI